jgi:sugar/nucleoside kinase (ribokinase family)
MPPRYDVIVVGNYCLDLIFTGLTKLPELGKDTVATGFQMIPGGAFNSAVAMHRLGLKVGWAGDFGEDDFSRFVVDRVTKEGLDRSLFVHHRRAFWNVSVAASYPHERAFISYYDPEPAVPAAMKALATASARALYVPGVYLGPLHDAALLVVRAKRMKIVMDGNSDDAVHLGVPAVQAALAGVDLLMPNAAEARRMTAEDDLARAIHALAKVSPLVVVKDGPRGAFGCAGTEIVHAPAIEVDVIDTTGAGDCFNAGFLIAWLEGRPLLECLRWGNVVGGLSTTAPGGTGRVVTRAVVEQYLAAT